MANGKSQKVVEITESKFEELCNSSSNYFCNGCIFDEDTDNLVAFPWYPSIHEEPSKYFMLVEE